MASASRLIPLCSLFLSVVAQSVLPVPPLQWIQLTDLLTGSAKPPPLKDAAIGYDETSRSIIVFGGESEQGIPQSSTYLLNLKSLSWSLPSPPNNLQGSPPARSAAISGVDFAASNRHGFVVIGGKGADGQALNDVWEFDFTNQFWAQVSISPGGPSARWGAAGGIDPRVAPIPDGSVPGPNNTFYLAGGYDGNSFTPLSDVWELDLAGVLSSNLPNNAVGSWKQIISGSKGVSSRLDSASTVISQDIAISGGCNTTKSTSCGQPPAYVIDTSSKQNISLTSCSAPRTGPVLVPNLNTADSSFTSQVYLLLGTFDNNGWDDQNGLSQGEVAILNIDTGSWSRTLPAGDPGSSGTQSFPSPRDGAAAVSYQLSLVGDSRTTSSDTIIFGGRDASGNYLSEVWLLRAYEATISSSGEHWSGFGDGNLQTGVGASGAGVTVKYLTKCATAKPTPTASGTSGTALATTTTASPTQSPATTPTSTGATLAEFPYDTSIHHKLFAPLSLTLFLPAFLIYRGSISPPSSSTYEHAATGVLLSGFMIVIAYGLGIAGIATSFTSITTMSSTSSESSLARRSADSNLILKTAHGRAGLAFFVGMYGVVPLLLLVVLLLHRRSSPAASSAGAVGDKADGTSEPDPLREHERSRSTSMDTAEKLRSITPGPMKSTPTLNNNTAANTSRPSSPRQRTHSWGPSTFWRPSHERRLSSDSDSAGSSTPQRGFEVVNRPQRRASQRDASYLSVPANEPLRRNLGDIDWLQRRRTLNAVGELDYALSQNHRARDTPSTPATFTAPTPPFPSTPHLPNLFEIAVHLLFHIFLLGLCIITLVALWMRAPVSIFAVFLVWTVLFYIILFVLAWNGRPSNSILAVMLMRLRADLPHHQSQQHQPPEEHDGYSGTGPYAHHQPPYRVAPSVAYDLLSLSGPRSMEADEDGEDEDEDTRQRRIEEEMGRRDVSIVTVPKRKLWVTNPSPS